MKRAMVVIALLALSTMIPMGPVAAVESFDGTARAATAEWWSTDGDDLTGVMVEVLDRAEHSPQGAVVRTLGMNVQVIEQGTDARSGEPVYRQLWTDPFYAPLSTVAIRTLASVSARATVVLAGTEWVGDAERAIGPYRVNVTANWLASGPVTANRSNLWDTQFGSKSLNITSLRSAPATATARIDGVLSLGVLGETTGELVSVRMTSHLQPGPTPPPEFAASWRLPGVMDAATTAGFEHVTGAFGFWQVGGDDGTGVLLDIARAHGRSDTGTVPTGTLEMYGSYCDKATDEWVSYDVFSGPVDLQLVRIPASLTGGSVVVTASLTGYESRLADCSNPSGEPIDQEGGPYLVTVRASWTATGAIDHTRTTRWIRGPDYSLHGQELNRGRQATATGTIQSALLSGSLGSQVNAFLYDQRTRTAVVGEPPD